MSTEHPEDRLPGGPVPQPPPEGDEWESEVPGKSKHRPGHPLPELDSEDGPPPRRGGPTG
ncbi:hypothetical protein [Amycolatopsis tolypomycina]|uniref:Uncharacterized protein n=1 Tax=Amycolatopsis tolypomycina TaxID=208445 RepID=A0A1H4IK45_9PSEU|nr:hypothetical protein [Amycolatopsis tolypomycina]SEB33688.1 hypothetical protein SAMN04489727_0814 [Amycolatopsis tolypomycina]